MEAWRCASEQLIAIQQGIAAADDDLDRIMALVVDGVLTIFPHASCATIEMIEGAELVTRAAAGTMPDILGLRLGVDESLGGASMLDGTAQISRAMPGDPLAGHDAFGRCGARAVAIAPIPALGTHVGMLKAFSADPHAFEEQDLLILQLLVGSLAYGLASRAHYEATRAHDLLSTRFAATFEQAAVGIAHVSPQGDFLLVNDRFCEIVSHPREALMATGFPRITHPEDLARDLDHLFALLSGEIPSYVMEKRYIRSDGGMVWVNLTVSLVRQADGAPDFFVAVIEDISARKEAEALAMFDALTGLPNRRSLLRELKARLQSPEPIGIAFLDLDRFKAVNDRFGHGEGDRCLAVAADALRAGLRTGDFVARLAGDEFVLLLPGVTARTARALLTRLNASFSAATAACGWEVGFSAGVVIAQEASAEEAVALIARADALMYDAKRNAADRITVADLEADRAAA